MTTLSSIFAVALLFLLTCMDGVAAPQRWAIVAASGVEAQQTADLLVSRLSENREIELVERESITAIGQERELMALLDSKNPAARVRILELMKADRLVLLFCRQGQTETILQATIVEPHYGARLAVVELPVDPNQDPVGRIIKLMDETDARYRNGIKMVMGIAPFTPNGLEQNDDYLSTTYRDLLQGQLSQLSGVAVIEVDEARAIATETILSGGDVKGRITPILIDGSYTTKRSDGRVALALRMTQGNSVLASIRKEIPLAEAASFFRDLVATHLMNSQMTQESVSVDDQFTWLANQAQEFSQLGMYQRALGLREAALLLKPEHTQERLSLLADYRGAYDNLPGLMETHRPPPGFPEDVWIAKGVALYAAALDHLEYLIMNRRINREIAADLISKHRTRNLIYPFPFFYRSSEAFKRGDRAGKEILMRAEEAEHAFHRRILPTFFTLPLPSPNRGLGLANFEHFLMESYLTRIDGAARSTAHFEECLYYFREIIAEDMWTSYDLSHFFGQNPSSERTQAEAATAEWKAFLESLHHSEKPLARALAEFGRIKFDLRKVKSLDRAATLNLVNRIRSLMTEWNRLPARAHHKRTEEPIYRELQQICAELVPSQQEISSSGASRSKPADWQTNPATWQEWGTPEMLGHLRFTKLDVTLEGESSTGIPSQLSFVQGNKEGDYCWNEAGIWRLGSNLRLSRIAVEAILPIKKVSWDGMYLWVLSGKDRMRGEHSLAAFDGRGRELARVKAGEFSPHDIAMRMAAVSPGVACITGTFGPHNRTWVAFSTLSEGRIDVKEIHHARELPTIRKGEKDFGDPNLTFIPSWIKVVGMPEGEPPIVLIGREYTATYEGFHPLAIDTRSHAVSVYPHPLGNGSPENCYFGYEGESFVQFYEAVLNFPATNHDLVDQPKPKTFSGGGGMRWGFFAHNGDLHAIGEKWHRINLKTRVEQPLTQGSIPKRWCMQFYGSSSNHGIIGFNGSFFAISFAKEHLFTSDHPSSTHD